MAKKKTRRPARRKTKKAAKGKKKSPKKLKAKAKTKKPAAKKKKTAKKKSAPKKKSSKSKAGSGSKPRLVPKLVPPPPSSDLNIDEVADIDDNGTSEEFEYESEEIEDLG